MRKPGFGEASLGAVAGTAVAGIGGLFAIGIAAAIIRRDLTLLFQMPILSVISWLVSVPVGWVVGGQVGPRLGDRFRSTKIEVIAGGVGGLIPVVLIALTGWYLEVHG
jgi:hypothetical protein